MKQTLTPLLVAALAATAVTSCQKSVEASMEDMLTKGSPFNSENKGEADGRVITFNIINEYPYYYALASKAVPCDVIVYDRHENGYSISKGETCSERQWDVIDDNRAPAVRECDIAVIIAGESGDKFGTTLNDIQYFFRIGSYDE